jgi:hypothetical protein
MRQLRTQSLLVPLPHLVPGGGTDLLEHLHEGQEADQILHQEHAVCGGSSRTGSGVSTGTDTWLIDRACRADKVSKPDVMTVQQRHLYDATSPGNATRSMCQQQLHGILQQHLLHMSAGGPLGNASLTNTLPWSLTGSAAALGVRPISGLYSPVPSNSRSA